jgi:SAM-dependent methyltransferase
MSTFSTDFINNIFYSKVNLPSNYFKKYENLPPCPVKAYNYNWGNYDFPRNWCILDFKEWVEKYKIRPSCMAVTCQTDPEVEFVCADETIHIPYPPFDLHTIDQHFTDKFDFFIFNQTLEHLYNPFLAVSSIYNTLKSGGYVFTSVPTLNIPHMVPFHFNGFTPMGLAMLFINAGFEVIEIGQWGNLNYINKLWAKHTWPGYDQLHNNNIVENQKQNVCQCWILARKI